MPKYLFEIMTVALDFVPVPGSFPDGLSSKTEWSSCSKVVSRFFPDEESAKKEECLDGENGGALWRENRDEGSEPSFFTRVIYMGPVYTGKPRENPLYSEEDLDKWWMYGMNNVMTSEDESLREGFMSIHPWTRKYLSSGFSESETLHEMAKNPDFEVARNLMSEGKTNALLQSRNDIGREKRLIFSTPRTCNGEEMSRVFSFSFKETEHGSGLFKPMNS